MRDLDGNLVSREVITIMSIKDYTIKAENHSIKTIGNFFCLVNQQEILIFKKKFDRYLFIDNVLEKIGENHFKFHFPGIVTSQSSTSMELSVLLFSDPKCFSKMLDSIEI